MDVESNEKLQIKDKGTTCELCSVFIPNESSMKAHVIGKKHTSNMEKKLQLDQRTKRSIYVSNISHSPCMELRLTDYFSTFGSVASIIMDKSKGVFAIIEFQNEETVTQILMKKDHSIDGHKITVKQREIKDHSSMKKSLNASSEKQFEIPNDLRATMQKCASVYQQSKVLIEHMQLTPEEIHVRNLLCVLLQTALAEVFSGCKVEAFGSSVNGFGVHNCDLDLNFHFTEVNTNAAMEFVRDKREENSLTEMKNILLVVAEIIKQCVPDCKKVKSITNARLPVVRFYHGASQMRCDISINNTIAMVNTKYLQSCVNEYPIYKNMVFFFRMWMKFWNRADSEEVTGGCFNNYAATLLVNSYLVDRGHLTSLQGQRKNNNLKSCLVDNWECSFNDFICPDGGAMEQISDTLGLQIKSLFNFLSKIDFRNVVLCIKDGKTIPKSDLNIDDITQPSGKKFKIGPVNIQDPFELNHNVAGNVGRKQAEKFIKNVKNAILACNMARYSAKQKHVDDWGLLNLLMDHHNKKSNKKYEITLQCGDSDDVKQTVIKLLLTTLTKVFFMSCEIDGHEILHHDPNQDTVQSVGCAVNVPSKNTKTPDKTHKSNRKRSHSGEEVITKRAKMALTSPVVKALQESGETWFGDSDFDFPIKILCGAKYEVWQGRRKARRALVQSEKSDIFELETQVSKLLLSDTQQKSENSAKFKFLVEASHIDQSSVLLSFSVISPEVVDTKEEKSFNLFFHHFETFLPLFIKKCLKRSQNKN